MEIQLISGAFTIAEADRAGKKESSEKIDTIKTENLYSFNGKSGHSLGQG